MEQQYNNVVTWSKMPSDKRRLESLISAGSGIAGAATGGAIGFLTGGMAGATLGGPLGLVISRTASRLLLDIADRYLSETEKTRVGATAAFAISKIRSQLDAGMPLRDDGFFDAKSQRRSDAAEIFEGVLLKAKNEHEEKKSKFLGNIFANVAFTRGFSVGEANFLLQIVGELTYRALCILALIGRRDSLPVKLASSYSERQREKPEVRMGLLYETISILQETYQLYERALIVCKHVKPEQSGVLALLGWTDVAPNRLLLSPLGDRYCRLLELNEIPEEDVMKVARYLTEDAYSPLSGT